jgi:hypothetical protein
MSVVLPHIVIPVPSRAEIGRATWLLLHVRADLVDDAAGLRAFVGYAQNTLDWFPCNVCKTNLRLCGSLIDDLSRLERRARKDGSYKVTAVVWAARVHACVTTHVPDASEDSKEIARIIGTMSSDTDVFNFIQKLTVQESS